MLVPTHLIHLLGAVNELGLANVEGFSNKTLFLIPHNIHPIFGVFWFIAVVAFLIAVFGLVTDRQWWRAVAIGAVIFSQILILIWWPDAMYKYNNNHEPLHNQNPFRLFFHWPAKFLLMDLISSQFVVFDFFDFKVIPMKISSF